MRFTFVIYLTGLTQISYILDKHAIRNFKQAHYHFVIKISLHIFVLYVVKTADASECSVTSATDCSACHLTGILQLIAEIICILSLQLVSPCFTNLN